MSKGVADYASETSSVGGEHVGTAQEVKFLILERHRPQLDTSETKTNRRQQMSNRPELVNPHGLELHMLRPILQWGPLTIRWRGHRASSDSFQHKDTKTRLCQSATHLSGMLPNNWFVLRSSTICQWERCAHRSPALLAPFASRSPSQLLLPLPPLP